MNRLQTVWWLLPDWTLPWLAIAAIAAWIVGARRLASTLAAAVAAWVFLPPLLEPWLDQIPDWVLWMASPLFVLLVIHGLITAVFGPETAGTFTGVWLLRITDRLLLGPFRLVRFLWRDWPHRHL